VHSSTLRVIWTRSANSHTGQHRSGGAQQAGQMAASDYEPNLSNPSCAEGGVHRWEAEVETAAVFGHHGRMQDLVTATDDLLSTIAPDAANAYLRHAVMEFREAAASASTPSDARNAGRALSRFCTEHMDWDADLYRRCMSLVERTQVR